MKLRNKKQPFERLLKIAAFSLTAMPSAYSWAQTTLSPLPYVIDFKPNTAVDTNPNDAKYNWLTTETGTQFAIANDGNNTGPSLFTAGGYGGNQSLKVSIPFDYLRPVTNPTAHDRFEYEWVLQSDSNAPHFDQTIHYFGFNFKVISSQSTLPTTGDTGVIFAQLWQDTPYAPPISFGLKTLTVTNNGTTTYEWGTNAYARDDTCAYTDQTGHALYDDLPLTPDTWHRVVVSVELGKSTKPGPGSPTGHAEVWFDGNYYIYTGPLGYNAPAANPPSDPNNPVPQHVLMVKSGIYRNISSDNLALGFANIEYSATALPTSP